MNEMLVERVEDVTCAFPATSFDFADAKRTILMLKMMLAIIMVAFMMAMWVAP